MLSNLKDIQLFERCNAIFMEDELTAVAAYSTQCSSTGNASSYSNQEDENMCCLCLSHCPQEEDLEFLLNELSQFEPSLENYVKEDQLQDVCYHIFVPKSTDKANKTTTIAICDIIGSMTSRRMLRVLFDSVSGMTLISKCVFLKAVTPVSLQQSRKLNALAGTLKCSDVFTLCDILYGAN